MSISNRNTRRTLRFLNSTIIVSKNTVRLAPDRFLAVFGIMLVGAFIYIDAVASYYELHPKWTQLIVFFILFFMAIFVTVRFCKQDSQLYGKILTQNVKSIDSLFFLARISQKIIKSVKNADSNWPAVVRNLDKRLAFFNSTNLVTVLEQEATNFATIEEVKKVLAKRFDLTTRVFCDQFFQFSPSIFQDRITKLNLNNKYLSQSPDFFIYGRNLRRQSYNIRSWVESCRFHLSQLRATAINMAELEALFNAQSTSGSVQQLVELISGGDLSNEDINLLFVLVAAYRGDSLFRRLLAISISIANEKTMNGSAETRARALADLRARLDLLLRANDSQSNQSLSYAALNKEDRKRGLEHWFLDTSYYLQKHRRKMLSEFETNVLANALKCKGKLYIITDSYSRTVRSALQHNSVRQNIKVVIFIIKGFQDKSDIGARLQEHITKHETWRTYPSLAKLQSGSTELLESVVRPGDSALYVTGATSVDKGNKIHDTSSPSLVKVLNKIFPKEEYCFQKIALAANYKLAWPDFYSEIRSNESNVISETYSPDVLSILDEFDVNETSLEQSVDRLTGGLYALGVDKIIRG